LADTAKRAFNKDEVEKLVSLFVGSLEIILTNLFVLYGVPIGLSGLAATLLRFLTFWLHILVGYATVQVVGARSLLNPKAREELETR